MSKHYLVTGGTGFIGSALVRRLLADGHQVRVLDNNTRGDVRRLHGVLDDVEMLEGDIRDGDFVNRASRGVDAIAHLAFINGTEFFYQKPELVMDVGVRGMLTVLDACRANDIGDLILASSSEVYQTPPVIPTPEDVPMSVPDPLNPRYSYGGSKLICELMAINYGRTGFERVVIFRPHNVVGPDMGWEHVLPQFALRIKRLATEQPHGAIPFPIQGDGSETRAFIDIDDFTDGVARVIERGEHLNIYHVGTQEERAIRELALMVGACLGRELEIVPGTLAAGGTLRRCPDISKLRGLGFEPVTPIEQTVRRLVEWYTSNSDLAPASAAR